jgi:hypothetical protein
MSLVSLMVLEKWINGLEEENSLKEVNRLEVIPVVNIASPHSEAE